MSSTILFFICIFTSTAFTVLGQQATNQLRCYVCESEETQACEDPVDVSTLTSADCSSLIYPSPREEDQRSIMDRTLAGVDGKFRGAPVLDQVFQRNGDERSLLPFKYSCLKVSFTSNEKKATTRTCGRIANNIKDACDFITQEVDPRVKVHSCNSCDTDNNCNSGSLLGVSAVIILSSTFFVIVR